ncbi:hypothetical protein ABEB36_008886 [Hypothenemus hampei]|uniref:BPL/LPL catalytic domain-containing protein n=1 Tax=Hypothenemus hampei TaxID=57062 RepID=A0ABD1END6_HYPHA
MRLFPHNVAKSLIYHSKCTDIFTNLALEDWFYKHLDFSVIQKALMVWRNEPCVVIGRHQNPWIECNFFTLPNMGVKLARRNSGGGTVYHDLGNLNLTFFTDRNQYNRKHNLELIIRALKKSFNIDSEINHREDLCINNCKISGTASKLGRTSAYHHCTLLVNANKDNMKLALKNDLKENIKTNATVSIRSEIMNLNEICPGITVEQVMKALMQEYNETFQESKVHVVEPIDEQFPGVTEIKKTFLSQVWRFEKTPKFTIFHSVRDKEQELRYFLTIERGKVVNAGCESDEFNNKDIFLQFLDMPFSQEVLNDFQTVTFVQPTK